ncbi:hypothetical protein LAZ67_7001478 [Cordylochernes scorpioides]|uniref:Uncharacterized protein n=1 Tax=Cordylochernes scorpioides TaxID=51811 RepID=A0ABY6KMD1_9ARAC|nr:hypothetical protein LAZ67_7001478 [Cordylochernes scorpioides]
MHLGCLTRPDITFALNKVSQKLAAPTKYDWEAVKRIFKNLVGTTEYGIMYQKGHKVGVLESFSDADFAGDTETRRSTCGVVCKLTGSAISWLSHKQRSVSLSTTEVELVAASNTAKEVIWLNRLFSEISPLKEQPIIKVDIASTIKSIKNPEFHKRTKYIEVRTTIPARSEVFLPKLVDSEKIRSKERERKVKLKNYYDKSHGAKDLDELEIEDSVWIVDLRTWGKIMKKAPTPRFYYIESPRGVYRRNCFYLRKG